VWRALVARTDTGLLTVSAVPAVPIAILPFGVERRVCCGGERGSARSVGLNVHCACVFLYVVYVLSRWGCIHSGCGGLPFDWKFSICTYGGLYIAQIVFANEYDDSLSHETFAELGSVYHF
jgi:hypothetical protein